VNFNNLTSHCKVTRCVKTDRRFSRGRNRITSSENRRGDSLRFKAIVSADGCVDTHPTGGTRICHGSRLASGSAADERPTRPTDRTRARQGDPHPHRGLYACAYDPHLPLGLQNPIGRFFTNGDRVTSRRFFLRYQKRIGRYRPCALAACAHPAKRTGWAVEPPNEPGSTIKGSVDSARNMDPPDGSIRP